MQDRLKEPIELLPLFRERVWGRQDLAPFFAQSPEPPRIGEVWFTSVENPVSLGGTLGDLLTQQPSLLGDDCDPARPGICPLLVKFLFTSERLSVQVHPTDKPGQCGKTEAWYVLDAQPGAQVALGFEQSISRAELKTAIESGTVEQLLNWHVANAGDVFFIPAGTVHAIGPGLTICEVQQNCDTTYRLYDYGRNRELHVEQGLAVARVAAYQSPDPPIALDTWRDQLIACDCFRIERLRPHAGFEIEAGLDSHMLLICVKGSGSVGSHYAARGTAWFIPAQAETVRVESPESEWILAYKAQHPSSLSPRS